MYRPYFYKSYYDLEELAKNNKDSLSLYKALDYELSFRSTPFALELRRKVKRRIKELRQDEILLIPGIDPNNIFLKPDFDRGERWLTKSILISIVEKLKRFDLFASSHDLSVYRFRCWLELSEIRRYQVPSLGRAELLTSPRINDLIDLKLIRFVQEDIPAPGIYLRFSFGEPGIIGIVRINAAGSIEGFHEYSESALFSGIIEATAFAYYRDLVIPGKVIIKRSDNASDNLSPPHSQRTGGSTHNRNRLIPRAQTIEIGTQPIHTIEEWHSVQEGEEFIVVGHMRWIRPGFRANQKKQDQAEIAGVRLPIDYTWVVEHSRGKVIQRLQHHNGELTRRTVFSPPLRASKELDMLLS